VWKKMEECVVPDAAGAPPLARSIGLANVSQQQLELLLSEASGIKIKPAVVQVEINARHGVPGWLAALSARHGFVIQSYGVNGGGLGNGDSARTVAPLYSVDAIIQIHAALDPAKHPMEISSLLIYHATARLLPPTGCILTCSTKPARIQAAAQIAVAAAGDKDAELEGALDAISAYGQAHPVRSCNPSYFRAKAGELFFVD
jgi:diketogulonate reductase-like aldo/keto reductase